MKDYKYEKELVNKHPLTVYARYNSEMEYNGIQHISLMSTLEICNATCSLATHTVESNPTGFQGIKRCIKYMYGHPHKNIFYPSVSHYGSNVNIIT